MISRQNIKHPKPKKKKIKNEAPLEMKHLFDTYNQLSVSRMESSKPQMDTIDL